MPEGQSAGVSDFHGIVGSDEVLGMGRANEGLLMLVLESHTVLMLDFAERWDLVRALYFGVLGRGHSRPNGEHVPQRNSTKRLV